MGIFPNRQLIQLAVYWGTPVNDGQGGFTWAEPIEIACRWIDSVETVLASDGREFVSRAKVHIDRELDKNGMLFLGGLDDLDSSEEADPATSDNAYSIRQTKRVPTVRGTGFLNMVLL